MRSASRNVSLILGFLILSLSIVGVNEGTMVKIEVYNDTEQDFTLKEGNAGVYRDITVVKPAKKHVIELDPNATYREYVVVYTDSGEEFITSDDCLDNSKITIQREKSKIFFIVWLPDTCRVLAKMVYASSKDKFKHELNGIHYELQATDPTEMDLAVIKERAK